MYTMCDLLSLSLRGFTPCSIYREQRPFSDTFLLLPWLPRYNGVDVVAMKVSDLKERPIAPDTATGGLMIGRTEVGDVSRPCYDLKHTSDLLDHIDFNPVQGEGVVQRLLSGVAFYPTQHPVVTRVPFPQLSEQWSVVFTIKQDVGTRGYIFANTGKDGGKTRYHALYSNAKGLYLYYQRVVGGRGSKMDVAFFPARQIGGKLNDGHTHTVVLAGSHTPTRGYFVTISVDDMHSTIKRLHGKVSSPVCHSVACDDPISECNDPISECDDPISECSVLSHDVGACTTLGARVCTAFSLPLFLSLLSLLFFWLTRWSCCWSRARV